MPQRASVADLARLNFLLGELYADAVLAAAAQVSREGAIWSDATARLFTTRERRSRFLGEDSDNVANGRGSHHRGAGGRAGCVGFSSGRHGGRGQRSAAGSLS